MLPAYQDNRVSCLLFIVFAFLTVFILMSMLLAVVSRKFSEYHREELVTNNKRREVFFLDRFVDLRATGGDFLDRAGMYMFFIMLHDLVEKKKMTDFKSSEVEGIKSYFDSARRATETDRSSSQGIDSSQVVEMTYSNPYIKKMQDVTKRSASWLWRSIVTTINKMSED
jgi:hypothetical protein